MSKYVALSPQLANFLDKPLDDLPKKLRDRVEQEFPIPWNKLNVSQRVNISAELDYLNDPLTQKERAYWKDFFDRKDKYERDLISWQSSSTPSKNGLPMKKVIIELLQQLLVDMKHHERLARGDLYGERMPVSEKHAELSVGSRGWRINLAKKAANARHNKPGGSRDKQQQMRELWSSGKYTTRDICAEQECDGLGLSFSTARKALRNTPDPKRPS